MSKPLEKLFGSRTRARLLGWFFAHTGESFSVRQLASILGDDPSNLGKEMAKLEDLGILVSSKEGNLKRFQVNSECAFGPELKGLVLKTSGIIGRIKESLKAVEGIDLAFIYGSFAKGAENADSDLDLLIVGDVNLDRLDRALISLEKDFGRTINYTLYDRREYEAKIASGDAFLQDLRETEKIVIVEENDGSQTP